MRKVLSIIVAAVLLLGVMPVVSFATEIVDSGTCGENLTWTLDDEGTLTISGEGEMNDYKSWNDFSSNRSPWNFNYSILSVLLKNGSKCRFFIVFYILTFQRRRNRLCTDGQGRLFLWHRSCI